jgi:hypothetical protein
MFQRKGRAQQRLGEWRISERRGETGKEFLITDEN